MRTLVYVCKTNCTDLRFYLDLRSLALADLVMTERTRRSGDDSRQVKERRSSVGG